MDTIADTTMILGQISDITQSANETIGLFEGENAKFTVLILVIFTAFMAFFFWQGVKEYRALRMRNSNLTDDAIKDARNQRDKQQDINLKLWDK